KKILKFEYPKTFKVNKSLEFLKLNRNHKLDIKTIKGNNLINILGMYKAVKLIGRKKDTSKFLKNSISSKRFKIIP